MILLEKAKNISYNNRLNASEDTDFFSNYLNGENYFVDENVYYFYAEFGSVSYKKVMEYNYYSLMRILYMYKKLKISVLTVFIKELIKCLLITILYPIIGKKFFLKNREHKPEPIHIKSFNKVFELLQK